jgi:hypothetical protein
MKISCALASAIILALCAMPANAQANRTWVSGTGSDSNTCTITAPCASFTGAQAYTNASGEIGCLNPGDFGGTSHSVTLVQSYSIVCDGVSNGGILATGGAAITINAFPNSVVYLSGLDLEGGGTGSIGVDVEVAATVYIVHCTIRGFGTAGVGVKTSGNTRVIIKDSIIVNNTLGVAVEAQGGATNSASIFNTIIDGNSSIAAGAVGTNGTSAIALTNSVLTGSPIGLDLVNGGSAILIGPSNTIAGAINGSPTSVAFK